MDNAKLARTEAMDAAAALVARQATQRTDIADAIVAARTAVGAVNNDSTDEDVMDADSKLDAIQTAITAAADLPQSEKDTATGTYTDLKGRLDTAKLARTEAMDAAAALAARQKDQRDALANAIAAARAAVGAVNNDSRDADVTDADSKLDAIQAAITAAADLPQSEKDTATGTYTDLKDRLDNAKLARKEAMDAAAALAARQQDQRDALANAIAAARTAVGAVNNDSTDEDVMDADSKLAAIQTAITAAADLPQSEKDTATGTYTDLKGRLDTAKLARTTALDKAAADLEARQKDQRDALAAATTAATTAVGAVNNDSSDDEVEDADSKLAALQTAIDNAEDLPQPERDTAQGTYNGLKTQLNSAKLARTTVLDAALAARQGVQRTALDNATTAAREAVAAVDNDASDDEVTDAETKLAALQTAIDNAVDLPESEKDTAQGTYNGLKTELSNAKLARTEAIEDAALKARQKVQSDALDSATTAATAAVTAVNNDSSDADVEDAETKLAALQTAIDNAVDLDKSDRDKAQGTHDSLDGQLDGAKIARTNARNAATMATARKLHEGIKKVPGINLFYDPNSNDDLTLPSDAQAATGAQYRVLKEDKKTMVPELHGWTGQRFYLEPDGDAGTYEAHVYSHIPDPTPGQKFGTTVDGQSGADQPYAYLIDANGFIDEYTTKGTASRIASSSFDQAAGLKPFTLGSNRVYVSISGTYHGVAGEYRCTPVNGTCAAQLLAPGEGFNLGGVTGNDEFSSDNATWTFKPTNPENRVTDVVSNTYASFGWWLHKSEDGNTFDASAFAAYRGSAPPTNIGGLNGTATYTGAAAGKYALYSTTGGTNDAGHFTARATLEANFKTTTDGTIHSITGTINNFTGADGESRDWSVELKEADISTTGDIQPNTDENKHANTAWTIGGTAASASGEWAGTLYDNDSAGVPKIGTGTFYTEYNGDGKMVGGFGVTNPNAVTSSD